MILFEIIGALFSGLFRMFVTKEDPSGLPDQTAKAVPDQSPLVGKRGTALCDLRPGGAMTLNETGETLDCVSDAGFVLKGSAVEIVAHNGPSLVVRQVNAT